MKHSAWHAFFLAWIVITGGVLGYTTAGSVISIVAGITLGGILLTSAYLLLNDEDTGWSLGFFTTVAILLLFAPEFQTTGDLFPAGLLATVSVWVLGAFIVNRISREYSTPH